MIKIILTIIAVIFVILIGIQMFSIFKKPNEIEGVLFSAVEGEVIKDGKPLAGVILTREWSFAEDNIKITKDTAVTDAVGRFSFPQVTHPYQQSRFLTQETIIFQAITVRIGNEELVVWHSAKHNMDAGTESSDFPYKGAPSSTPLQVTIDLDSSVEMRGSVVGHTIFK